jgi:hypothetical protein
VVSQLDKFRIQIKIINNEKMVDNLVIEALFRNSINEFLSLPDNELSEQTINRKNPLGLGQWSGE